MAITAVASCLGPPPLPPGKRFLQKSSRKLSSTYKSFRDPAVEAWLLHGAPEDPMAKLRSRETTAERGTIAINQSLFRSCSEGNLRAREKTAALSSNTPLDKCIKAIYGSWKNLLYRKCADIAGCNRKQEGISIKNEKFAILSEEKTPPNAHIAALTSTSEVSSRERERLVVIVNLN